MFLSSVRRRRAMDKSTYPGCVPAAAGLEELAFHSPVTVIAGGNGAGKTTLMEIFACGVRALRIDSAENSKAEKRAQCAKAAEGFYFRLQPRPRHCFYFQAEDFIRYVDNLQAQKREARRELERVSADYAGHSAYARGLAAMPHARALDEIESLYGDIAMRSHGEGFLDFFAARLHPGGLYLLDEPEGALSYENQMVMLALLRRAVAAGSQFILATHSPVMMACPEAEILALDEGRLAVCAYDDLQNVAFLRRFLSDRERMLRLFGVYDGEEE